MKYEQQEKIKKGFRYDISIPQDREIVKQFEKDLQYELDNPANTEEFYGESVAGKIITDKSELVVILKKFGLKNNWGVGVVDNNLLGNVKWHIVQYQQKIGAIKKCETGEWVFYDLQALSEFQQKMKALDALRNSRQTAQEYEQESFAAPNAFEL